MARVVLSPEEFDSVQRDEIVVCRMTSPAWVVLFTRISGLVTDAGGMALPPRRGVARVRHPGGGRHLRRDPPHQDRATGRRPGQRVSPSAGLEYPLRLTEAGMPDAPLVLPFRDPRCRQVALAGGKGASLAAMTAEGRPVPPGFVIASTAFEAAVDTDALRKLMRATDVDAARAMVSTAEPPREPIGRRYAELDRAGRGALLGMRGGLGAA